MISKRLFKRFYPDDTKSGTIAFYSWLRQCTNSQSVVLNLGAGPETGMPIRILRDEVAKLVGADPDPVVLQNREVHEAHQIIGGRLPFDNAVFDVVFSDYVLEHVNDPSTFMAEIHRVLKPGGRFFFRTPNTFHYVTAISRATPHWFHRLVANRVRGLAAEEHEPWPTYYRLNTARSLRQHTQLLFASLQLRYWEAEPLYMVFNSAAFLGGVAYERCVNAFDVLSLFRANIFGLAIKG